MQKVVRAVANLLLYFSLLAMLPPLEANNIWFVATIAIVAFGVAVEELLRRKGFIKYLALLPLVGVYFLPTDLWGFVWSVPAILYGVIIIFVDGFGFDYWNYTIFFRLTIVFEFLYWIFGLVASFDITASQILACLYFVTGIYLCRLLRFGNELDKRGGLINLVELMIPTTVLGGLCLFLTRFDEIVDSVFYYILYPLFFGVSRAMYGVNNFFIMLAPTEKNNAMDSTEGLEEVTEALEQYAAGPVDLTEEIKGNSDNNFAVVYIILAIIFVVGLILLIRYLRSVFVVDDEEDFLESIELEAEKPKRRQRKELKRDNAYKIRRLYRRYLRQLRHRKYFAKEFYTSKKILVDTSKMVDVEAAERFRELYIKARYKEADITDEEVAEASAILKKIFRKP